jgi:hypothetical protein
MKTPCIIAAALVLCACTKSSSSQDTNTPPTQPSLTGTWQASIDAGDPATDKLQYILVEDAGTLTGVKLVNDPVTAAQFHTLDMLSGTHNGTSVILHTTVTADTITAVFDGGTLVGVDPFSDPVLFRDGGPVQQWNLPFSMTRISTNAPIPDAGDFQ